MCELRKQPLEGTHRLSPVVIWISRCVMQRFPIYHDRTRLWQKIFRRCRPYGAAVPTPAADACHARRPLLLRGGQ
jgi:hypothetical protein